MIERKSFTGGLSTDRDGAYLQPNQYLNALNIRVSSNDEGSEGALANIKGNEKVTFTMPSGTNTCIGSFEDSENSRVFYFVHNSSDDHMILCYFHKEGTIRKVMEQDDFEGGEDGLNFSTSNLITGVGMNDDLLFFTDNSNEPKRINVERGLKKHDSSYTQLHSYDTLSSYSTLRDTHTTIIRQAPTLPPTQDRFYDASIAYNNISEDAYTFAYRFTYVDGEVSSLSPYSTIAHRPNPDTSTPETDDNAIKVTIPGNQEIGNDVLEIEYLVKYNQEPNFSVFYIEKNYERILAFDDDGEELSVVFRNDTTRFAIPTTDVTRYASAVPVKAKALECARGRVFLGDTTEGLNNLNESGLLANTSIYPYVQQSSGNMVGNYVMWEMNYIDSNSDMQTLYFRYVKVQGSTEDGYYTHASSNSNPLSPSSDEVADWEDYSTTVLPSSRWATSQDLSSPQVKIADGGYNAIRSYIETLVPSGGSVQFVTEYFPVGQKDTNVTVTGLTQATLTLDENVRLWKSSSAYRFGLFFMDRYGRQGRVIELTEEEGIAIPSRGSAYSNVVKDVKWSLPTTSAASYIPDWAHAYSFVRTASLTKSFFVQFPVKDLHYVSSFENGNQSHNYTENTHKYIQIEISSLAIEDLGYTYSEGDLITLHNVGGDDYTLQVVHQTGEDIYALCDKSIGGLNVTTYTVFAEIYTPKLINELEPYFEFGETYHISNPGASNRTWSTSSGNFEGDIVIKDRQFGTGSDIHMQMASANIQNANEWIQLTGRGFNTTRFQQVRKPTAISFSENRLQGSLLNGLSMFNALDESTLPQELGSIQKLLFTSKTEATGNTMLAIGVNETASVYIGQAQIQTSGGAAFLAVQSGVIGSSQVLRGSYGTLHPESVVEQNNRVYFLDALNGTIVQYDVNGLMPIGDSGIKSFFRERCNEIVIQGKTGCHGGFDAAENEYILTLPEITYEDQDYLDDYITEVDSTDVLTGYQDPTYNGAELSFNVDINKGKKYRVEISAIVIYDATISNVEIKYSDDTSIGNLSSVAQGGYIEFEATQASTSLKAVLTSDAQAPDDGDGLTLDTSVFTSSYYKLENGDAVTIAYSEDIQKWTTFYSYLPEHMQSVGTQFITFKNGELWKHDVSATRNNFYGTQYKSRISSICKQMPSAVKTFATLAIEGDTPPSFAHFRTEAKYMNRTSSGDIPANPTYSDYIQSSDLSDAEFRQYEGVYYAALLRDRLEPMPSSYDADAYNENMIKGQKLMNQFMLFTLEFDNTSKLKVRFADIGFNIQRGHKL